MALTAQQMVQRVKDRTHCTFDMKIIGELASAKDWAFHKVFKSADGPDQLSTFGTELSINAQTREYDLGAQLSGTIYGVKLLWLKFSSDSAFTPMVPVDSASRQFVFNDQWTAADTTTVAEAHPVMYDVVDFAKVRFSPPLPSGSKVRVDYWLKPPDIDPVTNNVLSYGSDIAEPLHESIVDKATAQIFVGQSDDRWMYWDAQAERKATDAIHVVNKRHPGPITTQPFRGGRRRRVI